MRVKTLTLFLFLLASVVRADIIYLKNDGAKEGKIVSESKDEIVLQIEKAGLKASVRIPAQAVAKIERKATAREQFLQLIQEISEDDAQGFYELGLWCEQKGLNEEANFCFQKTLEIDPGFEEAAKKLGLIKVEGQWCTISDVSQRADALYNQKNYAGAIRLLEALVSLPSEKLHSVLLKEKLFKLARCYEAVGRWNDAIEAYERSVRFEPDHPVTAQSVGGLN